MAKKSYYEILGVRKDATSEEIKRAYRKLAKKYHPDLHHGDKANEARFKEINEANYVLSDKKRRQEYEMAGKYSFGPGFDGFGHTSKGGPNPDNFGFNLGGLENIFGDIFGGGTVGRGRPHPSKGRDIEYEVSIGFDQMIYGTDLRLTVDRSGKHETINVRIPPGVKNGSRVRVAGKGSKGALGRPHGDLYIITKIKPHRYYKRVGDDLSLDVPITPSEAVLGGKVTIPTVDGKTTIKIPSGTQNGQKLKIKDKGLPHLKGKGRGDMYAVIKIAVPKTSDPKIKELFKEIQRLKSYNPRDDLW